MSDKSAKQQIVEKFKDSNNILVTVNTNPTVDELSAALGFTLLANKLNKHATAVFSGAIPPAITFLDPESTFEDTVNSLRDFIIALDKEKADHLRYKVEGDMVKIFITPYRTTISESDLDFSQGDYNVELVIAIGVQSEEDLDKALSGHGRILHDAAVASLSIGSDTSELGTISWHEDEVSSYSEMLVSLIDLIKETKNPLDEQIATAFLTGIVAATERFSNQNTNSETMTIAAQLMAAGANQQLIATKLEESNELEPESESDDEVAQEPDEIDENQEAEEDGEAADGSFKISHEKVGDLDEVAEQVALEKQEEATEHAEKQLAEGLEEAQASSASPSVADLQKDLQKASENLDDAADQAGETASPEIQLPPVSDISSVVPAKKASEPAMGGTLNATTDQAAEDKRRELNDPQNRTILSHDTGQYVKEGMPSLGSPVNSYDQAANAPEPESEPADAASEEPVSQRAKTIEPISQDETGDGQTLAEIDEQNRGNDSARDAVDEALKNAPDQQGVPEFPASAPSTAPVDAPQPVSSPTADNLPPLPPMPDFSTLPPLPGGDDTGGFIPTPLPNQASPSPSPAPVTETVPQPTAEASDFAVPPNQQQAQQEERSLTDRLGEILPPAQPAATVSGGTDPSEFKIPGQS